MDENISLPKDNGGGFLVVQVTTANGALPLEGASVSIRNEPPMGSDILYTLKSGADGRTARVALPAPSRESSLTAGAARPFATYQIAVSAAGFERAEYRNVPIFDGSTAIQQATLAPLPEAGYTDDLTRNPPKISVSENGARL